MVEQNTKSPYVFSLCFCRYDAMMRMCQSTKFAVLRIFTYLIFCVKFTFLAHSRFAEGSLALHPKKFADPLPRDLT